MDNMIWLTLGMMAVTYLGRVAGYWFIRYTEPNEKTQAFLRVVPGTIFIAMISPQILSTGWIGWLSAIAAFFVATKSANMLFSLLVGMSIFIMLQAIV